MYVFFCCCCFYFSSWLLHCSLVIFGVFFSQNMWMREICKNKRSTIVCISHLIDIINWMGVFNKSINEAVDVWRVFPNSDGAINDDLFSLHLFTIRCAFLSASYLPYILCCFYVYWRKINEVRKMASIYRRKRSAQYHHKATRKKRGDVIMFSLNESIKCVRKTKTTLTLFLVSIYIFIFSEKCFHLLMAAQKWPSFSIECFAKEKARCNRSHGWLLHSTQG